MLSVISARDEAHAVELANDTVFGLNNAVFTNDTDRAFVEQASDAGADVPFVACVAVATDPGSAAQLRRLIQQHRAGEQVAVAWTDAQGATHSATVELGRAPVA